MQYSTGKHCVFYHRYHTVWSTKYRFKVLHGPLRLRVRDICRQVCAQNGVEIIKGVLSSDHVHMFVSVPPKLAIGDLVRLMEWRSSHKIQREFPQIKKRYWGCHFWGRGYFSTTNGAITALLHKSSGDSCRESSVVAGLHEKTYTSDLQDDELGCL